MARFFVGIDIGTSGSKGVLVDTHGTIVGYRFVEHRTSSPRPGWLEHDADAIWWHDLAQITRSLLQQANANPREIAAVAVSALAPAMLPLDEAGHPLRPALIYSDARARAQVATMVGAMRSVNLPESAISAVSALANGPKILWFRENEPSLFRRTAKIHTCTSYLVYRLTGQAVTDEATARTFVPLYDPVGANWNAELCAELGIPLSLLPQIACRWGTDIAGSISREAAAATGLAEGTLVTAGATDGFADFVSTGAVAPGEASLSYGTTMLSTLAVDKEVAGGFARASAIPGLRITGLATSASGALTTWFRDNLAPREQDAEQQLGISAYQLLSQQAEAIPPGSAGLVVLPYFAGERSPIYDPAARGLIIGLTLSHTRRHLYRALLESIAYSVRHNLDIWQANGAHVRRIVATGGGTRSKLWTQIVSDVTGMDQEVVKNPIGAPYGDAFLAAYGAGTFTDMSVLKGEWAPEVLPVRHDRESTRIYESYYRVYRELYENNKDSMHTLVTLAEMSK